MSLLIYGIESSVASLGGAQGSSIFHETLGCVIFTVQTPWFFSFSLFHEDSVGLFVVRQLETGTVAVASLDGRKLSK